MALYGKRAVKDLRPLSRGGTASRENDMATADPQLRIIRQIREYPTEWTLYPPEEEDGARQEQSGEAQNRESVTPAGEPSN